MKYRFLATISGVPTQLNPLGMDKAIKSWNKENDQIYYREELGSELIFTASDFTALYALETSSERCTPVPFTIERNCSGYWQLIYTGSLSFSDGSWKVDQCRLDIKAAKVDDYSCLQKGWGEKVNILDLSINNKTVQALMGELEETSCFYNAGEDPDTFPTNFFCDGGEAADGGWVIKKWKYYYGTQYRIEVTYVREVIEIPDTDSLPAPWILISTGGGIKTYAREPILYDYQDLSDQEALIFAYYKYKVIGADEFPEFDNGVHLEDLLPALVSRACPDLTVKSEFYQINPDTATSVNYVTGAASKVLDLIFFQKSDVRRSDALNNATKAEMSLEELLSFLKITHNIRYEIEGTILRIEHLSWFSSTAGLNLNSSTYATYVKGKHSYTYDKNKMPKYEEFRLREQLYLDFVGKPITYDSLCVNQEEKSNHQPYSSDAFITDLQMVLDQSSDTENLEGIVVIATNQSGSDYSLITEPPVIDLVARPNNSLAWAQLHRDYHKHGRVLYTGSMNGVVTAFISVVRTKKGEKITIPLCCADNFNPRHLVSTMMGDGEVDQASFNFQAETLELVLLYDADNPNSPPTAVDDTFTVPTEIQTSLNIGLNDTDLDGNLLPCQIVITQAPVHGTIENIYTNGTVKYTPAPGYTGSDLFKYKIKDNIGALSNEATVSLTVAVPTTPPVANDNTYTAQQNQALIVPASLGVLANDSNWQGAGSFSVTSNTAPAHGTVSVLPSGAFTYTPTTGYTGADSFTYTITSLSGYADTATVNITVVSALSSVYARIELENEDYESVATPSVGFKEYADVKIFFYQDASFLIPASVSGLLVNYNEVIEDFQDPTGSGSTAHSISCSGFSQLVYTQIQVREQLAPPRNPEFYISDWARTFELAAGSGYLF